MPVSYRSAGVDIVAGDRVVEAAKAAARATLRSEIVTGVGGFGALFRIPRGYRRPLIVTCEVVRAGSGAGGVILSG